MGRINKAINRIKAINTTYRNDCRFSSKLADIRLRQNVSGLFHRGSKDRQRIINTIILDYLSNTLSEEIECFKSNKNEGVYSEKAPIWVCWWQGEENAPDIVRQCIKSIRKNAGCHPVYIITGSNYGDYLDIPDYILSKVSDGRMCIANFSDYLRFSLLEKYGGLWLDATIYVPNEIPESYFSNSFFTCNAPPGTGYLSNGRWTSFCVGGWAHCVVFRFMKCAFEKYWEKNDTSIDYLIVDYLLDLGYSQISSIKESIDSVPLNNLERNLLAEAMMKGEKGDALDRFMFSDTKLYKLSWREKYPALTKNGQESIYSTFLTMKF